MSKVPTRPDPIKFKTSILGEHRGNKRLWIDKARLSETSFRPGESIDVKVTKQKAVITIFEQGERIVSQRRGEPVIDINNKEISKAFKGISEVTMRIERNRIVITPLKEETEQKRALCKINSKHPTFIDIFAGGGTLTESFKASGAVPVAAVEIEDRYLDVYEKNNPDATTYATPLQNLDVSLLPDADIVLAGVPCECFSTSGIAKRNSCGLESKESGDTGYLAYYVLQIIGAIRPATVVIEEVPAFANSAICDIVRNVLRSYGYIYQSEAMLDGSKMGSMTKRKRFCMVASMKKGFSFTCSPSLFRKTFGDILDVSIEEREWLTEENSATIRTYFRRMEEHKAKSNGFSMQAFGIDDEITGTFTKGYYKRRLTDPILKHPTKAGHYSFMLPRELARIHDLPESYKLPEAKTTAGEIIGQGVDGNMFKAVAHGVMKLAA